MQKFSGFETDARGNALVGATVAITNYPGGTAASIYRDNGVTLISGNSVTTSASGYYEFYAANGHYSRTISGSRLTTTTISDFELFDPVDDTTAAVSPMSFGAVGNGVADDAAALLAATATGRVVDGYGKTYGVTGYFEPDAACVGLINMTLKQLAPTTASCRTLYMNGKTGFLLRHVYVDRNGNAAGGTLNDWGGIWLANCSEFIAEHIGATGGGAGSGIVLDHCHHFKLDRPVVHGIRYTAGAVPADDVINGVWLAYCYAFKFSGPRVYDCGGTVLSVNTKQRSRGVVLSGCHGGDLYSPQVQDVDQGVDITGDSNYDINIYGGYVLNCYTFGYKCANSNKRIKYFGSVAEGAGLMNFIASGPSEVSPLPMDILYKGCVSVNAGADGGWAGNAARAGFRIQSSVAYDPTYPRGVVFDGCLAIDNQGTPTMQYGFVNDVATGGAFGDLNRLVNGCKSVGHAVAATSGFSEINCIDGIDRRSGASPTMLVEEIDAAADEKIYDTVQVAGDLLMRTRTDANGAGATFATISRTGTAVDLIQFDATAVRRGGAAVASRYEQADAQGLVTQRFDNNGLNVIVSRQNFAITAAGQGQLERWHFGVGGALGAVAYDLRVVATDDWSTVPKQSSQAIVYTTSAGSSIATLTIDSTLPLKWTSKYVPYSLAHSAVQSAHTGDTTKTALSTIAIPANSMGPNGIVKVTMQMSWTNSANNKTITAEFGGTVVYAPAVQTTTNGCVAIFFVRNRNATNSQVAATGTIGSGGATTVTAAIDTTAAVNLIIYGQLASAGESIAVEGYDIEIVYGA